MAEVKQRTAAKKFVEDWTGKGYEKGESQKFWIQLLREVLGVETPEQFISFEDQVHLDHTSFIDARIPATKVLIEQKSSDKDLYKAIKQSDGSLLNPFQQAKRYITELPLSQHPRWVVTCNFQKFCVYDMERPNGEPQEILLKDLEKEYYRLSFLVDTGSEHLKKEMEVSIKAGEIVGLLYDTLLKQYKDCTNEESLKSLNILCVRLVFCLYAEDAGIFGKHDIFLDYLRQYDVSKMRKALIELFTVLNTKPEDRDPYLEDDLKAFPYVNGGLFADEDIEIPNFTEEIKTLLLVNGSENFDWSEISPTIFGAVFESTLNKETRRKGGMHYTSVENIHKVIDPLFLDSLRSEFKLILQKKQPKALKEALFAFQKKLSELTFLDPACGSGNFLTETYLSLRRLENDVLRTLSGRTSYLDFGDEGPIRVQISQFYGIEINDFAVSVAQTALWIAESQMLKETEDIIERDLDFLPLKSYTNILEANALRISWESVIPKHDLKYIMGNPPFIGARLMPQGSEKKREVEDLFGKIKDVQDLDYVCGWFRKAAEFANGTDIEIGFVATNSICQGAQVPILWGVLYKTFGVHINFAFQTFKWESEAADKAAVHCVIVGFSNKERKEKTLYIPDESAQGFHSESASCIGPYLVPGMESFVVAQKNAICDVPKMSFGNQPRDGGHFVISEEERDRLLSEDETIGKYLRKFIGATEFINNKKRWCLWLKGVSPVEIVRNKILREKVEAVREFRLKSKAKTTNGYAKVPHLFAQITQPDNSSFLIIPRVSSENREYIPIGFEDENSISSDAVQIVPGATIYHFGVLTSLLHMAWMRTVAGRLEMRYRYSKEIVYNTFPWPVVTDAQRIKIERTAQAILDARALYQGASLAEMYGEQMPVFTELVKAHEANDRAVMEAYGFDKDMSESEIVAKLMQRYEELTRK